MHRDPSFSMVETIARLEGEVAELRALGGKQRERRLLVTTVVSMIVAIHALIGWVGTKVQADRAIRDASKRLTAKASDLVTCVQMLDERNKEVDTWRARSQDCSCAPPPDSDPAQEP